MTRPHLLDALRDQILLCDGAMGTRVQALDLEVERDYWGQENCTEVLNLSRPDLVREIHRGYFEAGADMVETNTFGGSPITLGEFGLEARAHEINKVAAELAREAADSFADGRHRWVVGSVGPGTKLPTLGNIDYDTLEAALAVQARGLLAGGADAILIETCQDPLQIKAAVNGAKLARAEAGTDTPVFVQVTVETTGTMLVGPDIAAAATVVDALDVPLIGLNCATGPQEMAEHVRWLAANWPGLLSVQPNAGLPELVDGQTRYPLDPAQLASWLERFIAEDGLNLIGGCCGTSVAHIQALDAMLKKRGGFRPAPLARKPVWVPGVASLYGQVPFRQENSYFSIGERCNANGSKKWRELQERGDWDGCVAMGREQIGEGSNSLDVCTAFVGRDEMAEMTEVMTRFTGSVNAPLVIDSTETPVIAAALKLHGGKAIINSINFEDGEAAARERLVLAKKFGAAVIALTIDETGMAKTAEAKLEVARRLVAVAEEHGLRQSDLLIDPLTFTIATGNEDDRKLGEWTLEGIRLIREAFPEVQIVLGLSNISFGLNPAARAVLNSVFLDHAVRAGMSAAIVHVSKIRPLHLIAPEEVGVMEDLIFDRRREEYDPLQRLLEMFADRKAADAVKKSKAETVEGRLRDRIVDGDRKGLTEELDQALTVHKPLDIINTILLDGMKVVGELFGAGKMQLPFVLQSAETMKAAVAHLEPLMERVEGQEKGTIVLATVKGDVHDIGKNLVDIILTNNGYRVVNLGIKVPLADMVSAAREHRAHAIGMSGLLVKSTVVMRENLEEMTRQGLEIPVMLGGAALTRNYVEEDCVRAYACGRVAYARDAFDGLHLMDKVTGNGFDDYLSAVQAKRSGKARNTSRTLGAADQRAFRPVDVSAVQARRHRVTGGVEVATPPFWGSRVIEAPAKAIVPFLNERSLYQFQWGFRKQGRSLDDFLGWAKQELRPVMRRMLALCEAEGILRPQAAYGYWKAAGQGNDLLLFAEDGETELARFALPRQPKEDGECIADFVRDVDEAERDVIGLQVVTVGQRASDTARVWFEDNRYQDYLYLHGLSVEMAEAMAEYTHKRIRAELGFAGEDDREMERMLAQGYRGSRYSFGYPACPRLEDQAPLLRLLGAERLGVSLSDEWQLHPEQSTSALVILNPRAKSFLGLAPPLVEPTRRRGAGLERVKRVAVGSIGVGGAVLALKAAAYWLTGSSALFSDALESVVNVAASAVASAALFYAARPADKNHPYGHDKAEFFAAVIEGVLIIVAALSIFQHAWTNWSRSGPIEAPWTGLGLNLLSTAMNGIWAVVLGRAGRAARSPALRADARHLWTDVATSMAVVAGVLLVLLTGVLWLDGAIAVAVGVHVLWSGWEVVRESVGGLMDEAPNEAVMSRMREIVQQEADGAIEAHDLRMRLAGRVTYLEFHLVVPGDMRVAAAHAICDRVETALKAEVEGLVITIHVEPEGKAKHSGVLVL